MRRAVFCTALVLALAGLLHTDRAPARGADERRDERPTLNVIAAGINSRGTGIFADTGVVRESGKTFRIELSADSAAESRLNRTLRGVVQYFVDSGDDPADVKVVRVSGPDDPALRGIVQEIAQTPHATVNIDMDLIMLGAKRWQDQTDKLARIAAVVAEERLKQMPDSSNSIFTHSAATVGLSKLIDSGKGSLFEHKVAASPMTWQLSSDVLIVQAAGDLPSTPTGGVKDIQLLNSASRNREGWLDRGNTVVRVSGRGFDVQPSAVYEALAERARRVLPGGEVVGGAREVVNELKAHAAAARLGVRDGRVEVSVPFSAQQEPGEPPSPQRVERFELSNVSSGQVIKVLNGDGGPSVQTPDTRRTNWDEFKDEVKKLEPPKGGGIALRSVAELPVAADEVAGAVWDDDAGRVVLNGRDGSQVWRLPPINPDIARAAYLCVYGDVPTDPEVSIGVDPVGHAVDRTAAGMSPVYYVGPIRDTQFGLILVRADVALGDIAYGGTPELARRGLTRLAGYHSLPEMYPAKYTDQPQADRLVGGGERIVIQSLPTRLAEVGRGELAYVRQPELAVRFGRTTPVERAYADIFGAHYYAILDKVPELRDLVECSRVVGILKWLRDNEVPFTPSSLAETPPRQADTPAQVRRRELPKLEDISPTKPIVVYGEHGPTDIYPAAGDPSRITYARGRVRKIVRGDGRTLEVYSDDRGEPIAFQIEGAGAAAFSRDAEAYFTFHDDVILHPRGGGAVSFERRQSSISAPETEPSGLVNTVASNFVLHTRQPGGDAPPAPARPQDQPAPPPPPRLTPPVVTLILLAVLAALVLFLFLRRPGRAGS